MAFKLSEDVVDHLLEKLGSDDDFRKRFEANPRAALASVGHKEASTAGADENGAWSCCAVSKLASKEQIQESRDALRAQLLSDSASFNPISLQAI